MIYSITTNGKHSFITVDFVDENVDLKGKTSVYGNLQSAEDYLPFFEKDLRQNYAELFPVAEEVIPEVLEEVAPEEILPEGE